MSSPGPTPIGVIETDAFCDHCGFNLHTQAVWRDERLGIPVCRCPECGNHAAAGMKTSAGSVWLKRAALAGLIAWLGLQLLFVLGVWGTLVGFHAAADEALTAQDFMTRDGRPVMYRAVPNSNVGVTNYEFSLGPDEPYTVNPSEVVYGKRFAPWLVGTTSLPNDAYRFSGPIETLVVGLIFAAITFAFGVMLGAMSWYWRKPARFGWLAVPAVATLFVVFLTLAPERRAWLGTVEQASRSRDLLFIGAIGTLMCIVMGLGLALAMPIARLAVSVLMPPKARQLFAFLWMRDGLSLPAASPQDA